MEGVLFVDGGDFNQDQEEQPPRTTNGGRGGPLTSMIVDHIRNRRGSGAVIVLRHLEDMGSSSLEELSRLLDGRGEGLMNSLVDDDDEEDWGYHNLYQKLQGKFVKKFYFDDDGAKVDNVIFVITTKVGASRTFSYLRKLSATTSSHVGSADATRKLERSIRNDLGSKFDINFDRDVNVIGTFMPLTQTDLEQIIQRKIDDLSTKHDKLWKRLNITGRAMGSIIHPSRIQYFQLKSDRSRYFSRNGAHDVDGSLVLRTLRSKIHDGWFDSPEFVAVLDYDIDNDQVVIQWCDGDYNYDVKRKYQLCDEAWRSE